MAAGSTLGAASANYGESASIAPGGLKERLILARYGQVRPVPVTIPDGVTAALPSAMHSASVPSPA
jgi:hypothetical protein